MSQISRPMQIMLAMVVVFALVWTVALKPKNDAEPVAAAPVTPAATAPPVAAGGAAAQSSLGKAVESANNAAGAANAATKRDEQQTGETAATTPAGTTPKRTPKTPAGTTPAGTTPSRPAATTPVGTTPRKPKPAAAKAKDDGSERSAEQRKADGVTEAIGKHLQAGRAVVVLVWSPKGGEDRVLYKRVKNQVDRRKGRVRIYFVPASQVGVYEGLLGSLNLGQTPSTIVIAPNNEAKVLGGLVSTARIDRLTSAALLIKPAPTK